MLHVTDMVEILEVAAPIVEQAVVVGLALP